MLCSGFRCFLRNAVRCLWLSPGLVPFLPVLVPAAHAARPMQTDDARIVDAGACQLESWVRLNRHSTEYWALPSCNPMGNFELTLGGAHTHQDGVAQTTDVMFQGKTVFKPLETNGWGIGLAVGTVRHPQYAIRGRDWNAYVPATFSFREDRVLLHTNLGWLRGQETKQHAAIWGVGSEIQLSGRIWLIGETFGQNQGRPLYQAGLRYWIIPNRVQIDTTVGNRFEHERDERWFTIGLRLL
ncbi:hypothetical protein [Candidatus Nitrotoga fabula]|uniref:Secreted protein n=1 Tax=Candidatus Nitrotoga fabula TaxID=2182327 RepID=A0A916BFK3_9PROT|nr:hypothetical protein [Candidatus Nitrotoga fabula]CAE6704544.1 conserved exported hypothetical protein [Candidatus Nitrotoga fabula]